MPFNKLPLLIYLFFPCLLVAQGLEQATPTFPPVTAAAPSIMGGAVEQANLPAPALPQSGIREERGAGLPIDLFKDSHIASLTSSFWQIAKAAEEGKISTTAKSDIAKRLALTRAFDPTGATPEAHDRFAAARIYAAFSLGAVDEAMQFLQAKSTVFRDDDWHKIIELHFLRGEFDKACAHSVQHPEKDEKLAQKIAIVCALSKGTMEAAQLSLDVLRESGEQDIAFLELAEKVITKKTKLTQKLDNPTTLHKVLMVLAEVVPSPEQLAQLQAKPSALLTKMQAPDEWRVAMAQHLARAGAMDSRALLAYFAGIKPPPEKIARVIQNPELLNDADEKEIPASMRLYYALAALADDGAAAAAKAHILAVIVGRLSNMELSGAIGEALMIHMDSLAPLPENETYAPQLARLVLLHNGKEMQSWWRLSTASPITREQGVLNLPLALQRGYISEPERGDWFILYLASSYLPARDKLYNMLLLRTMGERLPSDIEDLLKEAGMIEAVDDVAPPVGRSGEKLLGLLLQEGISENIPRLVRALMDTVQPRLAQNLALSYLRY